MGALPLTVAISALVKGNQILLIKRERGEFVGLWGLPGGKVELSEHVSEAAVREIVEESGIKCSFKDHLGFVSEHVVENGQVVKHFLLHVCELEPEKTEFIAGSEGELAWFDLNKLSEIEGKIIPSDFMMIQKLVLEKQKGYYECIQEKKGDEYSLKKFEFSKKDL